MSGTKIDVLWSPVHHDKFIIWGPDITLYEVARLKDIEKKTTFTRMSSTRGATVVASQSASGVRCVDVSALSEQPEPLLALGHGSGRVTLNSLRQTYDPLGLVGQELVPKYPRPCNAVAWSRSEPHLLLTGMDKHRSDYCIQLWDMQVSGADLAEGGGGGTESSRPLQELAAGEAALAAAWCSFAPRTIVASMNCKHIKLYDLRESCGRACGVTSSRQWAGVCAEAGGGWLLAARGEGAVAVWDARALHAPLLTLPQQRPPRKIQWCPTRRNLLVSLQRDASALRLHDVQQAGDPAGPAAPEDADAEEGGGVVERDVPAAAQPLATFSWHPAHEARLLAVCLSGALVEVAVCERVTLAWGAGQLVWAGGGGGGLRALPDSFHALVPDIAHRMRARAPTEYGLKADLWQNADLADDEALSNLWHFLALSKSLVEDGCIRNSPWKHPGVRSVLRAPGDGGYRSEAVPSLVPDLPGRKVTVYRSAERTRALQLCGWGWGWESAGAGVERAEAEGTPCRAAALAAFHLRPRAALDVLARAHDPRLRVAALALAPPLASAGPAGASPDERLWRDALAAAAPALPDAYLRAMLHFLAAAASSAPDFTAVLNETEMRLEDRVAFACLFLSDGKLHEYIRHTSDALLERADLSAILLTGVSGEGLAVLQRWVEAAGDVQSAALVAARCCPPDLLRDPRAAHWLDSYRSLLDSWRLWWSRCALDTWVCAALGGGGGGAEAGGEAARRVAVACTYCGKSVAAAAHARPRPAFARLPPPAAKMKQISSCPHCRKPLPRCGVCSLHLGGGGGGGAASFGGWFSWCVACRHGGHAAHLLHWFSEHSECPVSSCSCRCSALDPPDRDDDLPL